jgi:hypothetical protein
MNYNHLRRCYLILLIVTYMNFSMAYDVDPPAHQHITNEATEIWIEIPDIFDEYSSSDIESELDKLGYNSGEDMIIGSGEEEVPIIRAFGHFWELDVPEYDNYNLCDLEMCRPVYDTYTKVWLALR